jgi:hypothetical protein
VRFDLFGGLVSLEKPHDLTEWNAWQVHFAAGLPEMDQDEETTMLFLTGRVPLYLHALIAATTDAAPACKLAVVHAAVEEAKAAAKAAGGDERKAGEDAEQVASAGSYKPLFQEVWPGAIHHELHSQVKNITNFSEGIVRTGRWDSYAEFIDAALVGATAIHLGHQGLYDHRYFYVGKSGAAHCVCGHVAECAALDLTRKSQEHFLNHARDRLLLGKALGNPSVRGFLIEHVMIAAINKNGLDVHMLHMPAASRGAAAGAAPVPVDAVEHVVPKALKHFTSPEDYATGQQEDVVLWVPYLFNYTGVDAVLRIKPPAPHEKPKVPTRLRGDDLP